MPSLAEHLVSSGSIEWRSTALELSDCMILVFTTAEAMVTGMRVPGTMVSATREFSL